VGRWRFLRKPRAERLGVWPPPPKYRDKEACNQDRYLDADFHPVSDRRGIPVSILIRPPV
jgi:hypothetical protein